MDTYRPISRLLALVAALACGATANAQAISRQPTFEAADLEFFESKIRPILIDNCFECHSASSVRVKGDFKLDTYSDLMHGGRSGPAILLGDTNQSPFLTALRYEGEVQMPPSAKLDDSTIALFTEWVRRGTPMPEAGSAVARAEVMGGKLADSHWAFQPLASDAPPNVANPSWCSNDIDRFILARLEAEGIAPPPRSDRATLLRRLSFDLTGLPPSAEDVDRFVRAVGADAWEREIDRLLASPHYGERWGRAWLDLARYSDSNGLDENLAMSTAYNYRDWVVRALNADLGYDRFLTLQLAGDLLPEPADEQALRDQLIATGFLVLGPKMLAEQDKEKLALDVVDEQIDVAFRTFQGLTLGCSRCHDHKFDPLSQRDYTAVAGMFKSSATMANLAFVSRWNERQLAPKSRIEARAAAAAEIAEAKVSLGKLRSTASDALLAKSIAQIDAYLLAAEASARDVVVIEAEAHDRGNLIRDDSTYGTSDVVVARTGNAGLQFAEYDLKFVAGPRPTLEVRMAAEEKRPVRVLLDGALVFEAALGEVTGSWRVDGQRWFAIGVLDVRPGGSVLRLERDGPMPHLDQLLLAPEPKAHADAEYAGSALAPALVRPWAVRLAQSAGHGDPVFGLWTRFAALKGADFAPRAAQLSAKLRAERDAGELATKTNALVASLLDGEPPASLRELASRYQTLFSSIDAQWRELHKKEPGAERLQGDSAEELRRVVRGKGSLFESGAGGLEPHFPDETRAELALAKERVATLEAQLPAPFDTAPGVRDEAAIADIPLMRRGNHLDKEAMSVPRGVPERIARDVVAPRIPEDASGRLELAQWMVDPAHPLTARVAVNRLWQGHFSFGLSRSASNFGLRGEAPTHPELLDWLAREFMARGWSQKSMHQLICMSSAYQAIADASPAVANIDPANRLLSHQNRRRLEGEEVRDALLCVGGMLDRTLGGSLLEIANGDYVTNDQSKNVARYDAPRRSIYLPIIRNAMLDLFSAFDYPDPSLTMEQRSRTTTATQSLYLMNSPFVLSVSARLAEQARTASTEPGARVEQLFRSIHGRTPRAEEMALALEFIASAAAPEGGDRPQANIGRAADAGESELAQRLGSQAWSLLAQALLISNEFLYVD